MTAYIIASITNVTDPGGFEQWTSQVRPIVAQFSGKFLTAGPGEHIEGAWQPLAIAIIEFPDMETLRECFAMAEQADVKALRQNTVMGDLVFVDGT